jgi:hypothetical protein
MTDESYVNVCMTRFPVLPDLVLIASLVLTLALLPPISSLTNVQFGHWAT